MKKINYLYLILFAFIYSCDTQVSEIEQIGNLDSDDANNSRIVQSNEINIYSRFRTPENYNRIKSDNKFGNFLSQLNLKTIQTKVKNYDGTEKPNTEAYEAIIDLPNPTKNVQYNSNAILRLRAEYLFQNRLFDKINFNIGEKHQTYLEYSKGDFSYRSFMDYIEYFLSKTNSTSIVNELERINWNNMEIGDIIFHNNSFKSHAVIVVDMAKNFKGEKIFMLAQSYYPSQEIHILSNPNDPKISPWYEHKSDTILTPEWRFFTNDLMRFTKAY